MYNDEFDGKLTYEEVQILRDHGVTEKHINKIAFYLETYKESLSGLKDLTGDTIVPEKIFYFLMDKFGYLLKNDPDEVLSEKGVKNRRIAFRLVQKFGPLFLKSDFKKENRNELLGITDEFGNYPKDKGIELPDEPVIWAPNHHYKDDALASIIAADRPFYILFGSLPQFYNSIDGALANAVGSLVINRKVKECKKASMDKANVVMEYGTDILYYAEGVWNKTPSQILLDYWSGIYYLAKHKNSKIVPLIHYLKDPTQQLPKKDNPIHMVVDDPIDISDMTVNEALDKLREVTGTWYYLMMEKYGRTTRKELLQGFDNADEAWENHMHNLLGNVTRYDSEIEQSGHFKRKDVSLSTDVFENIANAEVTKENCLHVDYARKLIKQEKRRDFQSRF